MSFIRPEAAATLKKWREAIIAGVILLGSLQAASSTVGLVNALSWVTALIGAALFIEGVRRARLPDDGGGIGVVEVDERLITYFAPGDAGGSISLDDLAEIRIETTPGGPLREDLFWHLTSVEGGRLVIPGNAENLSLLYELLPSLPGVDWDAMTRANKSAKAAEFRVWSRAQRPRIDS